VEEIIVGYAGLSHQLCESSALMAECAYFDILLSLIILNEYAQTHSGIFLMKEIL
jgi:hypothetical protein